MKKVYILAAIAPVIAWLCMHSEVFYALLACSPVFGIGWLFWRFHRWHRGFHANRRQYGIHRAPSV